MSRQLIDEYRADLDRLRAVSGSRRESVLREAFKDLLKRWGRTHDLQFIPEHDIVTPQKNRIYLDGALLHALRVPFGYWEAKDADDDLDAEIAAKTRRGYPRDNIIYSDDHTAVLIQDGHEVARVAMDDTDALYTCSPASSRTSGRRSPISTRQCASSGRTCLPCYRRCVT